jgi:hypothetical protein
MSNYEKARKMRKEFDKPDVFGGKITFRQIWWIIKFAKTVRKFARSNAALYNLCNELFVGIASFKSVPKLNELNGMMYKGLQVTMKIDGIEMSSMIEDSDGDEE